MISRNLDPVVEHFRRDLLPELIASIQPQKVIVFGSRARGDALKHSDLDLVIVADRFSEIPWLQRPVEVLRLFGATEFAIEVLCYTPDEYERKAEELGIVRTATEEGLVLV